MEWIRLRSESIGSLAMFMLCLVVALYLVSIRNKSRDGKRITILFILFILNYLEGFIGNSIAGLWSGYILQLQDFTYCLITIYLVRFIYGYQQNYFKKEGNLVLLLSSLVYVLLLYYQPRAFWWTSLLHLLNYLWITVVLLRKMVNTAQVRHNYEIVNQKNTALTNEVPLPTWQETLIKELKQPTSNLNKAYRSFALWNSANIAFSINAALLVTENNYDIDYWVLVHLALILIILTWLVITYMNHAVERTTFQAKIVGLVLCFTLLILGLLGAMLYGKSTATGIIGDQEQKGLQTIAILILVATFIIIVLIPFFLRSNLLKPLNQILEGVKRVNTGDLTEEVKIQANDEIGYLSMNFNQMITSLREYTNQMESLVEQRTIELKQQKEQLQSTLENLKATQSQLIQKEKMASLGELTAGIAHEIQNPLNFVNNFSEVSQELCGEIEEETKAGNTQEVLSITTDLKQNLEKISHHGKRADSIVKGMLEHSRTSAGEKQLTDINALAEEYLRLSYHGLRAKDKDFNASLITDFDASLSKVEVVPQELGRVFLNLFNNAFYATQQKKSQLNGQYQPQVQVSTKLIGDKVEILVRDNGIGVPESIKSKIFQPFFTTKPTGQGTGLGLSLSYDIIIKGHGGELKVDSKEGEYAEFIIKLPIKMD